MAVLQSKLVMSVSDKMTGRLAKMSGALSRFQAKNRAIAGSFIPGGNLRTLVGAVASYQAITGSIRGTVGAAMGFESAMADVKKVVSASPREFKGLERSVLGLSKRLPVAASGLADIMANAGQSGIATKNLTAFTELTAKSAVAFGMSTAQIADIFPKLKNVFELDIAGLRDFADTANHLSNNMAANAAQILNFTNRAAGAAKTLSLSYAQLEAAGAGMISSGVIPETAARGLTAMANRLASGGPKITKAFSTMGWSFKEWRKLRDDNGPEAMTTLFEKVASLDKDEAAQVWKALAGQDFADDFSKVRPEVIAKAFELVADKQDRAGSVMREYAARAATAGNALARLRNNITAVGIEIGSTFLPSIASFSNRLADNIGRLSSTTDDIFDKIGAAFTGLKEGLGFDGDLFAGIKDQFLSFERFIFGTDLSGIDVAGKLNAVAARSQGVVDRITERFRAFGEALRGLISGDFSKLSDLSKHLTDLLNAFGAVNGAAVAAGTLAIASISRVLIGLGFALMFSRAAQIAAMATAISQLVEAVGKAEGLGDVVAHFQGMSTAMQLIAGFGGTLLAVKSAQGLYKLGKAANNARKWLFGLNKTAAETTKVVKAVGDATNASKGGWLGRFAKSGGGKNTIAAVIGGSLAALLFSSTKSEAGQSPKATAAASPLRRYTKGMQGHRGPVPSAFDLMGAGHIYTNPIDQSKPALMRAVDWMRGVGFQPQREGESDFGFALRRTGRETMSSAYQLFNWLGPGKLGYGATIGAYLSDYWKQLPTVEAMGKSRRTDSLAAGLQGLSAKAQTPGGILGAKGGAADPNALAKSVAQYERIIDLANQIAALREKGQTARGFKKERLGTGDQSLFDRRTANLDAVLGGTDADIKGKVDRYILALSEGTERAREAAKGLAEEIRNALTAASEAMVGSQGTSALEGGALFDQLNGVRDAAVTAGQDGGQGLGQGIASGMSTATAAAQSGVAQIMAAFTGLAQRLYAAGSNAALQLAAGLRSQMAAVSAASNALAQTVANKFPQSPAKEGPLRYLPQMGQEIVRQLAGGMKPGPASAAASVLAAAIAGAGSTLPATAGNAAVSSQVVAGSLNAGGQAVQIHNHFQITVNGADDPQALANRVVGLVTESMDKATSRSSGLASELARSRATNMQDRPYR